MEKRYTLTNLLSFTQCVSEVLDDRGQVDVVYIDFQKAFGKVSVLDSVPLLFVSLRVISGVVGKLGSMMELARFQSYSRPVWHKAAIWVLCSSLFILTT